LRLIVPEDAIHKLAGIIVKSLGESQMKFAYQDFYAYQFVDKMSDIIRRALKVRDVFAKRRISEPIKKICREAYLTFIYGYHTGSISACRSIVEALLKDGLQVDVGELKMLNDMGHDKGLYRKEIHHKIDEIRKFGNRFIHGIITGKPASESDNLKILGLTQEVLQAFMHQ
jgi:hypothetical protein